MTARSRFAEGYLTENLCQNGQGKRVWQWLHIYGGGSGTQWDVMSGEGLSVEP